MKTPIVYGQKPIVVDGKEYVVLGFRERLSGDKFHELCDILKDFGCRYVPDTRKWIAKQKVYEEMMAWFEKGDEWAQKFLIDGDEYDAIVAATKD